MGISSTRTRLFGLSFVAVLAAFLLAVPSIALSGPPANTACFECHAAAGGATSKVDFAAPADLSGCEACHRYGVHDFDDFHVAQNAAPDYMSKQCSGCHHSHATYGPRPALTGWPTVFTASGWFQSAASLSASSGALHAIHANGSWLKDQPECASCHGAAACTACHAPPADDHADHASLGTRAIASVASIGRKSGDAVSDTYLYSSAATGNYSSGTTLYVGRTSSGEERSLLRFPLTGLSGSTATTATLVLTRVGASAFPLRAYRLRRSDWSASNWNTYKPGSSWSAPGAGADYYPELFAESAGTTFDITALLSAALAAGDSSLDLIVLDPAPVARRYTGFYSSECLVAAWAPVLNVSVTRPTQLYAYGPVAGTEPGSPSLPAYVTPTRGCLASACHDLDAAGAVSLAPTCVSCHPDRSVAHGFDPEKHTADFLTAGISGLWGGMARPDGYQPGTVQDGFDPEGDGVLTAAISVFPVSPASRWDKVNSYASNGDLDYISLNGVGRATFTYGDFAIPDGATISDVTVYYRHKRFGAGTLPALIGASLTVGGSSYDLPVGGTQSPTSYVLSSYAFTTNPRTGLPWARDQINSKTGPDSLQQFGVFSGDASPSVRVTECYLIVNYTMDPAVAYGPIACETCHDARLDLEHSRPSASSAAAGCGACHPQPRGSFTAWGKGCAQANCHPTGSATALHHNLATAHVTTSDPQNCTGDCHYADITSEHHKALRQRNLFEAALWKYSKVTCEQCHQSTKMAALNGSWPQSCAGCHTTYHATLAQKHTTPNLAGGYAAGMGGQRTCPLPYNGESCSNPVCHKAASPLAQASDVSVVHAARGCGGTDLMCHNDGVPSDRPGTGFLDDCGICHYSTNVVAGYPGSF